MQVMPAQSGMLRQLSAREFSDGTLWYLLMVAPLFSPRPPQLLILNEPETSPHPDLISPLASMIRLAFENSQVIVVSHIERLVRALESDEIGLQLACKRKRLKPFRKLGTCSISTAGSGRLDKVIAKFVNDSGSYTRFSVPV